jgi:hypothetical protein
MQDVSQQATMQVSRATFLSSNQLAWIAGKAARAAGSEPDQAIVAVFFSCAYVEAVLNELLHHVRDRDDDPYPYILQVAKAAGLYERSASLERKLRVLCLAATHGPAPFDRKPLQDFDLLIELRNWVTHLRPEELSVAEGPPEARSSIIQVEYQALATRLVTQQVVSSLPDDYLVPVISCNQATWSRGLGLPYGIRYPRRSRDLDAWLASSA